MYAEKNDSKDDAAGAPDSGENGDSMGKPCRRGKNKDRPQTDKTARFVDPGLCVPRGGAGFMPARAAFRSASVWWGGLDARQFGLGTDGGRQARPTEGSGTSRHVVGISAMPDGGPTRTASRHPDRLRPVTSHTGRQLSPDLREAAHR